MPNTIIKPEIVCDYDQLEQEIIALEQMSPIPFISGTFLTNPSNMVKKCKADGSINPYWNTEIKKLQTRRVLPVVSYKKRIEGNSKKEGIMVDYTPKELSGKMHLPYAKSILTDTATRTKRYFYVEWFEEIKDRPSKYILEGNELDKAIVSKYINYPTAQPVQNGQQRKVHSMTLLFSSIIELNMNGKRIIVRHPH